MKQINKKIKRGIGIVAVALIGCAAIWGILVVVRNTQKKPANVYAVSDFAMTEYWEDAKETEGLVTTDRLQKVMISDTQKVNQIFVEEGQTIKKGDSLLSYDTTLSDLEVKKAEINLQRSKLQLTMAEKELKQLNGMTPHSSVLVTPSDEVIPDIKETPYRIQGTGTVDDPYYYLWSEENEMNDAFYQSLFSEGSGDAAECYVVLLVRDQNALNGEVLGSFGLCLTRTGTDILMRMFLPDIPEELMKYDAPEEPYYEESGSEFTAAELKRMREEKVQEINDLKVAVKLAELEFKKMENEAKDGKVTSTIDGTVITVRDPEEAYKEGKPVIEVSGGGGYYINASLSELDLDQVEVGQIVKVNSWMSGESYEGTITEILTYPKSGQYFYSNGNQNVSYYPFKVSVDAAANLQENEYVNVQYENQSESGESFYLETPFVRTENGASYVFVRNERGVLERRTVQTGKDVYGSYTEIKGGLTMDDFVAFPYGKDVFEGAKTREATMDELYGY